MGISYLCVISEDQIAFNGLVNDMLRDGWQLQGGVSLSHQLLPVLAHNKASSPPRLHFMFAQALIRSDACP